MGSRPIMGIISTTNFCTSTGLLPAVLVGTSLGRRVKQFSSLLHCNNLHATKKSVLQLWSAWFCENMWQRHPLQFCAAPMLSNHVHPQNPCTSEPPMRSIL